MILFFMAAIIGLAQSLETIPEPDLNATPEFYLLTKLMNRHDFGMFNNEFRYGLARYNFSESAYSTTCHHAYLNMRFTEWDMYVLHFDLIILMEKMAAKNLTDRLPDNWISETPQIHLMSTSRQNTIEKLAEKALPETKQFVLEVQDAFSQLLIKSLVNPDAEFVEMLVNDTIIKDMDGMFDEYFELFSESLGMNIDELLKGNEYLSSLPKEQVIEKFKRRAAKHNVPAQEYVDTCTEMFAAMKLDRDEIAALNQSSEDFMGKGFGMRLFSSVDDDDDELIAFLYNESAPFINILSKRWNIAKARLTGNRFQYKLRSVGISLKSRIVDENNSQVLQKILDGKAENRMGSRLLKFLTYVDDLEPVLCVHSTVESILGREIENEAV